MINSKKTPLSYVCTAICLLFSSLSLDAKTVYFNGKDFKGGYFIVPKNLPSDGSKVWVVVDVHGAGGLRKEGGGGEIPKILDPEPIILIVPSFTDGYQAGDGKWAEQMIANFDTVQKSYPVHDKMFVHGHSGGGQFAHRFAFAEPDYVIGISAHSSGSWACSGGYGSISRKAIGIPFSISCGESDTAYSVAGLKYTRIEWYHLFAKEMRMKGFAVADQTWPNVGHAVSSKLYGPQLKECFLLATQGVIPKGEMWHGDVAKIAKSAQKNLWELGNP